jgi:hypothetical protein
MIPATIWLSVLGLTALYSVAYWPRETGPHINGTSSHVLLPQRGDSRQRAHGLPGSNTAGQTKQAAAGASTAAQGAVAAQQPSPPDAKVLLELFVMSMCPDANFCEHYFDKLLEKFHPIVHVEAQ